MPRGHHKDPIATAERHFHCKRSFISTDGGEFLAGRDWLERKEEVTRRDHYRCQKCNDTYFLDPHHIIKKGDGGDDSLANLLTLCRICHEKMHPEKQVCWTQSDYPKGAQ